MRFCRLHLAAIVVSIWSCTVLPLHLGTCRKTSNHSSLLMSLRSTRDCVDAFMAWEGYPQISLNHHVRERWSGKLFQYSMPRWTQTQRWKHIEWGPSFNDKFCAMLLTAFLFKAMNAGHVESSKDRLPVKNRGESLPVQLWWITMIRFMNTLSW